MSDSSPGGEYSGWPGSRSRSATVLASRLAFGTLNNNALASMRQNVDFPAPLGPQAMTASGRSLLLASSWDSIVCQSGGGSRIRSGRLYGSSAEDCTCCWIKNLLAC